MKMYFFYIGRPSYILELFMCLKLYHHAHCKIKLKVFFLVCFCQICSVD